MNGILKFIFCAIVVSSYSFNSAIYLCAEDKPKAKKNPDAQFEKKQLDKKLDRLIQQLDDQVYRKRQAASEALEDIGQSAIPRLEKISDKASAEAKTRAAILLRKLYTQRKSKNKGKKIDANFVKMTDCVWGDKKVRKAGDPIYRGDWIKLKKGLVELKYNCNTTVIIQGPFVGVVDFKSCQIFNGKITVQGPVKISGFSVRTPAALYCDMNVAPAEFGITVGKEGKTLLHVLKGGVLVLSKNLPKSPKKVFKGETLSLKKESLKK